MAKALAEFKFRRLRKHFSNQEQTKFGECLLPFGSESFVIPPAVSNVKVKIYKTIILSLVCVGVKLSLSH
jgi:hypothetical protein